MSTENEPKEQKQLAHPLPSKKRKCPKQFATPSDATATPRKKAKMKKTPRPSAPETEDDDDLDLENGINRAVSTMSPDLLADHVAARTRQFESDLSPVELADRSIPASAILDTTSFGLPRTSENLPAFLERFAAAGGGEKKLWGASKMVGSPHTLVVTGAALRAADLARILRPFSTPDSTIAKLFAKHIKITRQIHFLRTARTGIAVGTPQRLGDLMDAGALRTSRLRRIVIDASHVDVKKRGVLGMRETLVPLVTWLARKELRDRLGGDGGGESDGKGEGGEGLEILFY